MFLLHRYQAVAVHFLTPTDDNRRQCERMAARGIFDTVSEEIGQLIVADVDRSVVQALAASDGALLGQLIEERATGV